MGRDQLPSAKERRKLLSQSSAGLGEIGRRLLREGRWGEALECLQTGHDQEGLRELAGLAMEAGDLFTWRRVLEALEQEPSPEDLAQMRQRAQELGKLAYAQAAEALLQPPDQSEP